MSRITLKSLHVTNTTPHTPRFISQPLFLSHLAQNTFPRLWLQASVNETNRTNQHRLASRRGGVWNESLSKSFKSRWASKVKTNAFYETIKVCFDLLRACQPVVEDSQNWNMNISLPIIESESADNTDGCAVVNTCFRWALMNFTVGEISFFPLVWRSHRPPGGSWSNDIMV